MLCESCPMPPEIKLKEQFCINGERSAFITPVGLKIDLRRYNLRRLNNSRRKAVHNEQEDLTKNFDHKLVR